MSTVVTKSYSVSGFHCSGCADNLGAGLRKVEGVIRADADFDQAVVEVRLDPARVTDEDVAAAIRAAGFEPA